VFERVIDRLARSFLDINGVNETTVLVMLAIVVLAVYLLIRVSRHV
jgi:hypothetical protein